MEMKELMEALDRIEGKMAETSEANKAELKRLGDEQVKLSRQLVELQQQGVKAPQMGATVKSVGDQFISADCFKAFSTGSAPKMHVEIDEYKEDGDASGTGATPTRCFA